MHYLIFKEESVSEEIIVTIITLGSLRYYLLYALFNKNLFLVPCFFADFLNFSYKKMFLMKQLKFRKERKKIKYF